MGSASSGRSVSPRLSDSSRSSHHGYVQSNTSNRPALLTTRHGRSPSGPLVVGPKQSRLKLMNGYIRPKSGSERASLTIGNNSRRSSSLSLRAQNASQACSTRSCIGAVSHLRTHRVQRVADDCVFETSDRQPTTPKLQERTEPLPPRRSLQRTMQRLRRVRRRLRGEAEERRPLSSCQRCASAELALNVVDPIAVCL